MATTNRRLFNTICNLVLAAAFLAGCGGAGATVALPAETTPRINPPDKLPAALAAWPALSGRVPGVPADYDLVGENDALRLYLKRATSALIVEDKRNGRLWRNSPADLQDDAKVGPLWRRRIEAPILVNYSGPDRGQAKVTNPQTMQMDYKPVEGGAHATYRFPAEGFELGVVYTLRDDCLQVTLPADEVVESKAGNGLVSVAVLSFFGATHDGEEGYIFFPDGSGALIRYTPSHPAAVQEMSTVIYGADELSTAGDTHFQQPAALPVFGQVSGDAAFVGMITQGDFDASIALARSGEGIDYNHTWANFIFRRKGLFSLTGAQPTRLYEPERIGGDRQVRYCFLTGQRANYVGMATRYRDFLIQERGARRMAAPAPPMHLAFFMGIERKTWFLRDLIAMTTFAEAQSILANLAAAGVARVDVTLMNWNQGGVGGRYPQRLPVEARLGGEGDLRALAAAVRQRGQRLFLQDNYLSLQPEAQGAVPYLDAIRGVDGLPVSTAAQAYFLNAQVALRQFAAHDMPEMAGLGAGGLWLDDFAGLAVPDTNDRYPLSRENFAATWMQISDLARQEFGAVAMTGGNGYAIPHADALIAVPMDSTHYDLSDEAVPFYQIVAHGLLAYTGEPYNLHNDGRRTFLRQIEYGAIPLFVLTEANSALLYRTEADGLWSTQYSFWHDEVIQQYRQMEPLAPLTDQFIAGHARLAADVYQTTYEDGTRVVVNYGAQPYTAGTLSVPAEDFVVIPGEE